ncbi:MAG TPA: NAD(P)H-binding protein [Actinomycetota bacterium]|nr:NAD(P)H-binding protein [Actinomycetota bacterium]
MRITVFGASGKTGRFVVEEGIERGHEIVAFVRDAVRFDGRNERLEVVEGDARDPDAAAAALRGSDGAISVLALAKAEDEPEHSEATRTLVEAAVAEGVRRIVVAANNHVFHDDEVRSELAAFAREHRRNRDLLRSSALDWTIVASPTLDDGSGAGSYAAAVDEKAPGKQTAREDLAAATLDALGHGDWVGLIIGVSS